MPDVTMPELLGAITRIGDAHEAFVKSWGGAVTSVKGEVAELRDRLEEVESKRNGPGRITTGSENAEEREHKSRFMNWLRHPHDGEAKNQLSEFESRARKNVSISSSASGGYAVPESIGRDIEKLERKFSPVRSLVNVVSVGTSDFKSLVSLGGAESGWVGESDSRSETGTPLLRERVPTMGELYAFPQATEWALDDMFFDVAGWLAQEVADSFAIQEGAAVLTGNGTNKPTGMLNTSPVTTADFASPLRAAAAYQYLACPPVSSPAVAEITADKLVDLVYLPNARYRANGTWAMNSNTAAVIRKLKDTNGQYLWAPGLVAGQPDMLLGYPVSIWEQMDDVGANKYPVAFGDFRRGYTLVDRTQLRITVDANITTPGRIKYFVRRREGGCVNNNDSLKWLKTTLS
jgi:HK97 family phage major capsid protein